MRPVPLDKVCHVTHRLIHILRIEHTYEFKSSITHASHERHYKFNHKLCTNNYIYLHRMV